MKPFWQTTSLAEMTPDQWESLCDGCGLCCLIKFKDADSGELLRTGIACRYLDIRSCRCRIYERRFRRNQECIRLNPKNVKRLEWLPDTCAYRRVAEGRALPKWHPLVSGDNESVHRTGISVRGQAISARHIRPEDLLEWYFPGRRCVTRPTAAGTGPAGGESAK